MTLQRVRVRVRARAMARARARVTSTETETTSRRSLASRVPASTESSETAISGMSTLKNTEAEARRISMRKETSSSPSLWPTEALSTWLGLGSGLGLGLGWG